jgi:hypothetical protein
MGGKTEQMNLDTVKGWKGNSVRDPNGGLHLDLDDWKSTNERIKRNKMRGNPFEVREWIEEFTKDSSVYANS